MQKLILALGVILLIVALGIVLLEQANLSAATQIQLSKTTTPASSYDPAQYGLPKTIAGYNVLAVLTPDNTACMVPESKRLVLQAAEPTVEGYLAASSGDILKELEKYGFNDKTKIEVMIVGPGTTLEEFLSENQKWNRQAQTYGCVRTGGPLVVPTP
jgi:hypothetical protein